MFNSRVTRNFTIMVVLNENKSQDLPESFVVLLAKKNVRKKKSEFFGQTDRFSLDFFFIIWAG